MNEEVAIKDQAARDAADKVADYEHGWSADIETDFAPKGLDPAIAQKMNLAIKTALADPDVQKKLVELGNTPRYETIEQFQATVKRDRAKWADVVKAVGAKVE